MLPSDSPALPVSHLLWWHYRWHLGVGLAVWAGLGVAVVAVRYLQSHGFMLHDHQPGWRMYRPANDCFALAVLLVGVAVPAAIGGLIRFPVMEYLSRHAQSRRELVWKSMLAFELMVVVAALVPWPIAYNQFSAEMIRGQLLAGFLLSLPWLLSTGLASRKLADALGLPAAAN